MLAALDTFDRDTAVRRASAATSRELHDGTFAATSPPAGGPDAARTAATSRRCCCARSPPTVDDPERTPRSLTIHYAPLPNRARSRSTRPSSALGAR